MKCRSTDPEVVGSRVFWHDGPGGPILWLPVDRYEPDLLRDLRGGSLDGLKASERLPGDRLERWLDTGSPFISEVPFFSRLFLDNLPLHKGAFEDASKDVNGFQVLDCHLPRVAQVRAVVVPSAEGQARRILVSSNRAQAPGDLLALAGS